jgi:hypothetical protein
MLRSIRSLSTECISMLFCAGEIGAAETGSAAGALAPAPGGAAVAPRGAAAPSSAKR